MRPERTRANSRASATARARMILKSELGWLRGYPAGTTTTGVEWRVLLPNELGRVAVDGIRLSRSMTAVNRLNREFPRVLTRIVGSRAVWTEHVVGVLAALKPCVHQRAAVPDAEAALAPVFSRRAVQRLSQSLRTYPDHADVLRSLSWALAFEEELLLAVLASFHGVAKVLDSARVLVGSDDQWHAVHWCLLVAQHGLGALEPLLALIANPRAFTVATRGGDFLERLGAAIRGAVNHQTSVPRLEPPPARHGVDTVAFLSWLSTQPEGHRRRALDVASRLLTLEPLASWESFWSRAVALRREAQSSAVRSTRARDAKAIAELFRRLDEMKGEEPRATSSEDIFALVRWYACDADRALVLRVTVVMDELDDARARYAFASLFQDLAARSPLTRVCRVAKRLAHYLRVTASLGTPRLIPWVTLIERERRRYGYWGFDHTLADAATPLVAIDALYSKLEVLALEFRPPTAAEVEHLIDLAPSELSVQAQLRIAELLEAEFRGQYLSRSVLNRALAISRGDPERLSALLNAAVSLEHEEEREGLLAFLETLETSPLREQVQPCSRSASRGAWQTSGVCSSTPRTGRVCFPQPRRTRLPGSNAIPRRFRVRFASYSACTLAPRKWWVDS